MKRRNFIKTGAVSGAALVIGIHIPGCGRPNPSTGVDHQLHSFLSISTTGLVSIFIPVPEIGQGVRTALSMLVLEELGANLEQVRIHQCDAGPDYGKRDQRAAGSNSVKVYFEPLRRAGAQAREMLKRAAADQWGIAQEQCFTQNAKVLNWLNIKSLGFGALVEQASQYEVPEDVELKSPSDFQLIGKSVLNLDVPAISAGTTEYGMDIFIDDMVYASIERCPTYGGKVRSLDASDALALPGIESVFAISHHGANPDRPYTREGIAVVGTNSWAVIKARRLLMVDWDPGVNRNESTNDLEAACSKALQQVGDDVVIDQGDVYAGLSTAGAQLDVTYKLPLIAHIAMEPLNCTIDLKEDLCEVWLGTQMPYAAWQFLSGYLELPAEKIVLHVPRIGGGFGRRLGLPALIEGVKIAREIKRPVKLFWTREDDILHDSYRPYSHHRMIAKLDARGRLDTWLHRQAGTSRYAFRENEKPGNSEFFPNHFPANLIPHFRQEYTLAKSNIPRSLIRAPGNNALAFVVESFIDELADLSATDPLNFRLDLLGADRDFLFDEEEETAISTKRMKDVLKLATEKSGWHNRSGMKAGHGMGIASYFTFDTYVAHVAEVSVDRQTGELIIHRFVSAVDCGLVVNRAGVISQVEGAIADGVSATLNQQITVENGAVQQSNYHDYAVLRMKDSPKSIEVHIVDSGYPPTGMGEPPYPPVAPALCNAIFAACGLRIRSLPIGNQLKME